MEFSKGPTQAKKKWVIPKNHIAYYLKKVKEEGVCIEMEVNAPQPEESTPRHQEDARVDRWDLYVQAYQWAGQEVSKGKLSPRTDASEVYLRFGINLSHTTCANTIHRCIVHKKGFQTKKRFVKRPRWHQVMNFGGWAHVIVYASVHLMTFV